MFWQAGFLATGQVVAEVMRKSLSGTSFKNLSHLDDLSDPVVRMRQMMPIQDLMQLRFNSLENQQILYRITKTVFKSFRSCRSNVL